jgi:hypothetical protein
VSRKFCLAASRTDTTAEQHLGCQQNTTTEHCSRRHLTPICQSDWATSIPHGKLRLKQNQRPKLPHSAIATPEPAAPAWLPVSYKVLVDRSAPQGVLEPPSKEWVSACLFYTNRLITLQDEPITRRVDCTGSQRTIRRTRDDRYASAFPALCPAVSPMLTAYTERPTAYTERPTAASPNDSESNMEQAQPEDPQLSQQS